MTRPDPRRRTTHDCAILTDRTHRHLGPPQNADLAYDEHIQWHAQALGHQCCDRNATTREAHHHGGAGVQRVGGISKPVRDQLSQPAPGIGPVTDHLSSLPPSTLPVQIQHPAGDWPRASTPPWLPPQVS